MLKELFQLLRSRDPNAEIEGDFSRMLSLATGLVTSASESFWGPAIGASARRALYEKDVEINQLQRAIRKRLVTRLVSGAAHEPARLLVLMSLTKDIERIGDYAKNLIDAAVLMPHPVPDAEVVREAAEIRASVESILGDVGAVLRNSDTERAAALTETGRGLTRRCDELIERIAASDLPARQAVPVALAVRYYKRIQGHTLNLLSSVTMPLHKLDYFDETLLELAPRD